MTPDGPGRYMGTDGSGCHLAVLEGGEFTTYEEA